MVYLATVMAKYAGDKKDEMRFMAVDGDKRAQDVKKMDNDLASHHHREHENRSVYHAWPGGINYGMSPAVHR